MTELVALLCRGRKALEKNLRLNHQKHSACLKEEKLPDQRQGLAHVLCQKMDEFSQENAKARSHQSLRGGASGSRQA